MAKLLLEDTFEYQGIPFIVKVRRKEMFVNGKTDEIRGVNVRGHPVGMDKSPRHWVPCKAIVALVRPDYPYQSERKWIRNTGSQFRAVELLEEPVERGLMLKRWGREPLEQERDREELAEAAIQKLKQAYKSSEAAQSL